MAFVQGRTMHMLFYLRSPYAYMDPASTNLTYMFCALLQDALTEFSYAAELAGLNYALANTVYGLTVSESAPLILWSFLAA